MNEPQPFDISRKSGALVPRGPVWAPQAAPATPPLPGGNSITLHFMWCSLVRWWKVALPVGLLLGAAAGAVPWFTMKPLYRAEAWLKIQDRRPYIAFPSEAASQVFVRTQIELIRHPIVLLEIVSDQKVGQLPEIKSQEAPVEWLRDHLQVTAVNGSELYQIRYEGPDPENAATIVNEVMAAYLDYNEKQAGKQNTEIVDLLEDQKNQRIRALERLQAIVREKTVQATGNDPGYVSPSKVYLTQESPVRAWQDKLTTLEVERQINEAKLIAKKKEYEATKSPLPAGLVDQTIESNDDVRALESALEYGRQRLVEIKGIAKDPKAASVRTAEAEIAGIDEKLKKLSDDLRVSTTKTLTDKLRAARAQEIAAIQDRIDEQNLLVKTYDEKLKDAQKDQEKLGSRALDLEFARNDMNYAEEVRDKIESRIGMLKTEQAAPTQVTKYRDALVPYKPTATPFKKVAAATLGGFVLPFALAVLWEVRVRRISSVDQITTETSLPIVGEITTLPVRSALPGRRSLDRFERHRSTFEESIAHVRTNLLLSDDLRELQVLAVASAISREGKSSLASQLAVSLANATGETTLLIDTDMRSPDLHEMFGLPLEPGLAEVLEHKVTLDDAIVTSWSARVHVLPAGRLMRSPHVLLGSGAFHTMLDEARARYRYIVIDSPPVLAASEALVVAKAADGTLLCTMRDISRVGQVRQATERLRAAGARPVGAVFSGVPPTNYAYKYGGYYNSPYTRRTWTDNVSSAEETTAETDDEHLA